MTLEGLDFMALQVDNLGRAEKFYTDVIGLVQAEKKPEAVVFATQPIPFAVRTPLAPLPQPSERARGVSFWFYTEDAPALHTRLSEAGVPIAQPLTSGPFGQMFTFVDPDGYRITAHDGR